MKNYTKRAKNGIGRICYKKDKEQKNSLHNQIKIELKKLYIDFNFLKKLGRFSDKTYLINCFCLRK